MGVRRRVKVWTDLVTIRSVQLIDTQVSTTHRANLTVGALWLLVHLVIFDPCTTVHEHELSRLVHDQPGMMSVPNDYHFERGHRRSAVTFQFSAQCLCGA